MWPGQIAYPFGMVFDANAMHMANAIAPRSSVPSFTATPNMFSMGHAVNDPSDAASSNHAQMKSNNMNVGEKTKSSIVNSEMGAGGDACPVAVYVDLSALRERGIGAGKVHSQRR
jgi:hypothetical protein